MGDREHLDGAQGEIGREEEQTAQEIESFLVEHFGSKVTLHVENAEAQSTDKFVVVPGLELGSDVKKILFDRDNNVLGVDENGKEVSIPFSHIKKVEACEG